MSILNTIGNVLPSVMRSLINGNFTTLNTDKVENASNIGTGQGVFKTKSGQTLQFRNILAGSNVAVSVVGDDLVISASAPNSDASTGTKGLIKTSVAPVSPTSPVALGENDPRVLTQGENDAAQGSSGVPSNTNRFVTQQDPALGAPTGVITMFGGAAAPANWLLCDGSAVSRSTYAALFAAIGTAYGTGNGTTTFNLPDFRGRGPMGKDSATFAALGNTGGEETHTLTSAELPAHSHTIPMVKGASGGSTPYSIDNTTVGSNVANTISTNNAGSGGAHNVLDPYLVVNFIIKT
jgi:microcystin-dependent protein